MIFWSSDYSSLMIFIFSDKIFFDFSSNFFLILDFLEFASYFNLFRSSSSLFSFFISFSFLIDFWKFLSSSSTYKIPARKSLNFSNSSLNYSSFYSLIILSFSNSLLYFSQIICIWSIYYTPSIIFLRTNSKIYRLKAWDNKVVSNKVMFAGLTSCYLDLFKLNDIDFNLLG